MLSSSARELIRIAGSEQVAVTSEPPGLAVHVESCSEDEQVGKMFGIMLSVSEKLYHDTRILNGLAFIFLPAARC